MAQFSVSGFGLPGITANHDSMNRSSHYFNDLVGKCDSISEQFWSGFKLDLGSLNMENENKFL